MTKTRDRTIQIRQFIIDHVEDHAADIVRFTADRFTLTQQAIQHHVNHLVDEGSLKFEGRTKARRYFLQVIHEFTHLFKLQGLQEDKVWSERVAPFLASQPKNVVEIANYAFTEMLNNAIDHSETDAVLIEYKQTPAQIKIDIDDNGVGIFKKIMTKFELSNQVEAVWELAKGKLTTDPTKHSGEGIFFTARACDYFSLLSGDLFFMHTDSSGDWLLETLNRGTPGTLVQIGISLNTTRKLNDITDEYANPDEYDYSFLKTKVPVSLLQYGSENLVSRSQAKRLLNRFDKFREVILNFNEVETIGQGFADEIFRVYKNSHPEVAITPVNMTPAVERVVNHVIKAISPSSPPQS